MNDKITGQIKAGTELDIKRAYFPGITIHSTCPKCGEKCPLDLDGDYLSYPNTGPFDVEWGCWNDECNHEWIVPVVIDITIRLAETGEDGK